MCLDIFCLFMWSLFYLCVIFGVIYKVGESFSGFSGDKFMVFV